MQYRYPDDPVRITMVNLASMIPGQWVGQKKLDGWRCPAYFAGQASSHLRGDNPWTYYSKDGTRVVMPPEALRKEFESLPWPEGIALDMEWMGPRQVEHLKGRHSFRIFDMLYMGGNWLGQMGFMERHRNLATIFDLVKGKSAPNVSVVPVISSDLVGAFEREKTDPLSEGLVLRMSDSGLVGDLRHKTKNPFWRKIKYRDIHEAAMV